MARILVVDDEAEVLILAESVVQQAGHEVIGASTRAEAEPADEKFDLVVTDIQLGKDAPEGLSDNLWQKPDRVRPFCIRAARSLLRECKCYLSSRVHSCRSHTPLRT